MYTKNKTKEYYEFIWKLIKFTWDWRFINFL